MTTRHLARWELDGVDGPIVVVDVIRAFSTAAYAFGAGAAEIYLMDSVEDALGFKDSHPGTLAMGEDHGLRPGGFDFPNSPAMVSRADLTGRTLVQRTSAGWHVVLPGGSGFVSLRLHAADTAGSAIDQTIIRAFDVAGR